MMGMETRLSLRQTQRMALTPMLQAAIKLLQLSRLELVQVLQQHIVENPVLDEEPALSPEDSQEMAKDEPQDGGTDTDSSDGAERSDFDWESYLENASDSYVPSPREEKESFSAENFVSKPRSIAEHLLMQLHMSTEDEKTLELGAFLIGNLDENGYLHVAVEEVSQALQASVTEVETALRLVQSFDPPGVAARNLKECLSLQLRELGQGDSLAARVITHFMKELEEKRWNDIAEKLDVSMEALREAIQLLVTLDPKPGRTFSTEDPQYIIPDVYIYRVEGDYAIALNDEGLPRLRISPYYRQLILEKRWQNAETREYIEDKMRQAVWLIRSIEQRQRTVYKVAESLVKFQRRFLDDGISHLRPLTLREVADDISVHESTVSRVTSNKYVYTPQGIFELKYFFHRGLPSEDGDVISSLNVKEQLKKIIQEEVGDKPISDQKLTEVLKRRGINISRRTVAKYRAQLKIPSSGRRRRL